MESYLMSSDRIPLFFVILRHTTLVGAQLRYAIHGSDGSPLAMLGFSTAAWRLAPRDRFIGGSPDVRTRNLSRVIDNPRFLILPWIKIPNLGSHILALMRRRIPVDWQERAMTPVLIETFVQTPRFTGGVYRASGWIHVGQTQGEGDMTGKTGMTNRKRTSGYAHCAKTGNGRSIEPIDRTITP